MTKNETDDDIHSSASSMSRANRNFIDSMTNDSQAELINSSTASCASTYFQNERKSSTASSSLASPCSTSDSAEEFHSISISDAGELPKKLPPEEFLKEPRVYARNNTIEFRKVNGTSSSYKPDLRVRIRTIGLVGALLPGIGCYLCIIYSYLFQFENVSNFTSTSCLDLHSPFPPVSFSIGVWRPQRYFWLVILTVHFPPRLLFGYVYKSQYRLGESEYRSRVWFPRMIRLQVRIMFLEAIGLIILSIFDMELYFLVHAIAFGVWLTSFNFNMLFNCILHYHSGIRDLTITHKNIFYIKCTIFLIAYPLSLSTAVTYFSYLAFCSGVAFALFAISEYILIGCNCLFYFLLVWELTGSRLEFFVTHKNCTTRTELDVI